VIKGSRAQRARRHNDALREAGFNAPENVAWGKLPRGREYLFSTAVAGNGVTHWLREELNERSGRALQERRLLLRALGDFIGRLHAAGFVHGDLRTSNVFAHKSAEGFCFALIDNERSVQSQPAAGRSLLRNLMQLNMLTSADISNTDRLRFFRQWRQQMLHYTDAEAQLLATESYRWAMRRLRKKGKV
jgi:aminoglycoside phosphotransferase (APT) family kinase protein